MISRKILIEEKFLTLHTVRSATDTYSCTQSFSIRFGWFRPLVSHKRKKNFVPAPCQHQFLQVNRNFELTLQQPHNDNNFFYFWKAVNSKSWFSKKLHQRILTFSDLFRNIKFVINFPFFSDGKNVMSRTRGFYAIGITLRISSVAKIWFSGGHHPFFDCLRNATQEKEGWRTNQRSR